MHDTACVAVGRDAALHQAFCIYTVVMMEFVGDYQYRRSDIIGHGAFAVVFRGSSRLVGNYVFLQQAYF